MDKIVFQLSADNANEIYTFAKHYIDSKEPHEALQYCLCNLTKDSVKVSFCDGHKLAEITLPIWTEQEVEATFLIAPPNRKFKYKTEPVVSIEKDEKQTSYVTATGTTCIPCEQIPYPFTDRIWTSPDKYTFKIAFKPSVLVPALQAFEADESVRMDFVNEVSGVTLTQANKRALVLPVKIVGDKN